MSVISDLRTIAKAVFAPVRGTTHAERLEEYYRSQARSYDAFRPKLLHGRPALLQALPIPAGALLLDLGGGTGSNIEALGERRVACREVRIVDLCPSLLKVAEERIGRLGWQNVRTVLADVTTWEPADGPADVVCFSYSLTMIPDWFRAIDQAWKSLRPGGVIGVTDFYVSRKWPAAGLRRHGWFRRHWWPYWFSWHNVFLSPDHLPYLQSRFETVHLSEQVGRVPYMWGLRAPYYVFIGRKA
jgi:S-adenosylmethionine-diacylgycerolhomoserine-N-methlytransferase